MIPPAEGVPEVPLDEPTEELAPAPEIPENQKYWAARPSDEIGKYLCEKVENSGSSKLAKEMSSRYARAYQYYYGMDPSGVHATSQILRAGEADELAAIRVNHSRPLVNTLINIITASKVSWVPKATNIDYQSIKECELAAAVLEYYFAEAQVSRYAVRALEEALVFSEGYILLGWDGDKGEDFAGLESETGGGAEMVKTGDASFTSISTWDVIRDSTKLTHDQLEWQIVRTRQNKFNVLATHPEFADQIMEAATSTNLSPYSSPGVLDKAETDDIPVYHFFHKRTPALPSGRHCVFLDNKLVLEDGELDFDEIPLYRVNAFDLIGTPYAYTTYLDILGIQELSDSLQTSIATNQSTLATQSIALEKGSEIDPDDIGGMRAIYYPQGGEVPQALQLVKTAPEIFVHLQNLKDDQRLLMGVNAVVQGETPSGELSGSALALLDAKALQQSSTIQGNYLRLLEKLGSGLLCLFNKRADLPRKIAVVGESSRYLVQEATYDSSSFNRIKSVRVELANPMSQSPAGRYEIAKELASLGLVRTPEQIQQVLTTGQLKPLTQSLQNELTLIQSENQQLLNGEDPPCLALDDHLLHAREHRAVMANPEVRRDPKLVNAILNHITEHEELYFSIPPSTLMLIGQQPPPMPGGPGGPPGAPQEGSPEGAPGGPGGNPNAGKPSKQPVQPTNPSTGQKAPDPKNQPPTP